MKELVKITKNKVLDTYFSEIMELPQVKKIKWENYQFKILLGGKGRGKSYLAFLKMKEYIQQGIPVIYMRNSLEEIKNMKPALTEMVKQLFPELKIRTTDEGISALEDGRAIITFVSTKNYNKISGNLKPYGMIFYDEFNQILKSDTAKMVDDFFNICQTVFRHNKWDIWCCGNTKTANNIIFNLLKIEPYLSPYSLSIMTEKDYYAIITYKPSLFKHPVAEEKTLAMMKDLNPAQYKIMMEGDEFAVASELVLNKQPENLDSEWEELEWVWVMDTKMYKTYEYKTMWYLKPCDQSPNERTITDLTEQGYTCITLKNAWWYGTSPCKLSNEEPITSQLDYKLKHGDCFFGDYYLYTYLSTVWGWRYVDLNLLVDH